MVSTYTSSVRAAKQGTGDNPNTWGVVLNEQVFDMFDMAINGVEEISISGSTDVSLTTANGLNDQARNAILILTGVLTDDISLLIPAVTKKYIIKGSWTGAYSVTVTLTGASTSVLLQSGETKIVFTDGSEIYDVVNTGIAVTEEDLVKGYLSDKVLTAYPLVSEVVDTPENGEAVSFSVDPTFVGASTGVATQYFRPASSAQSTDITILQGGASSTNGIFIPVASNITKGIDSSWTVGSGNGGLDTGTVTSSQDYYVFLIRDVTNSITDVLISASLSSPTLPTGYTEKALVGFLRTNEDENVTEWHIIWSALGPINAPIVWQMLSVSSSNVADEVYFVFGPDPASLGARMVFTSSGALEADDDVTAFASD